MKNLIHTWLFVLPCANCAYLGCLLKALGCLANLFSQAWNFAGAYTSQNRKLPTQPQRSNLSGLGTAQMLTKYQHCHSCYDSYFWASQAKYTHCDHLQKITFELLRDCSSECDVAAPVACLALLVVAALWVAFCTGT